MAPASNEEQFKFLISCIRYSNNGKVDFQEVANECGIVSKGATAKRYERMMKAHGIHHSQNTTTIASTPVPSPRRKSPVAGTASSKKRKLDHFTDTNANAANDDDEGLATALKDETDNVAVKVESSKAVKTESGKTIGADKIKEEPESSGDLASSSSTHEGPLRSKGLGLDGADDDVIFNDFVTPYAIDKHDDATQATDNGFDQRDFSAMNANSGSNNYEMDSQECILIAD